MLRPGTRILGSAIIIALVSLVVASSASAQPTKPYLLTIAPTPGTPTYDSTSGVVASGETVSITATFTNENTTQQMGSANVFWPTGFNVLTAKSSVGSASIDTMPTGNKACTYQGIPFGPCIQLRDLSLAPGATFTLTMTVTTPKCQAGSSQWLAEPKQANNFSGSPGNDLSQDPRARPPRPSMGPAR